MFAFSFLKFTSSVAFHDIRKTVCRNMKYFYAVARGHEVGIFDDWPNCSKQVNGFKNAKYKKFNTREEAEKFIKDNGGEGAKAFLKSIVPVATTKHLDTQNDFWPESDGDSFENIVTDEDLLKAIYEVEGLPNKSLKRKTPFEESNNFKRPKYSSQIIKVSGSINAGGHEFSINEEGFVICYTDGSCVNNGKSNAIAGFGVYFSRDHPLNASKPIAGRVTNNAGEIQAAIHALQIAHDIGIKKLCICTDSQFLINAATMWISAWKRRNWLLKDGTPVKNVMDFKVLDLLLEDKRVTVQWNYVKGHANIEGNEMADKLAKEGAAEYARSVKLKKK